jgi:hypothetical protein
MTEYQLDLRVEKATDTLDRALMTSRIAQAKYDAAIKALDQWAERQRPLLDRERA